MKFSSLTQRIVSENAPDESPIDPWAVHNLAMRRVADGDAITLLSIGQETDETTPQIVVDKAIESLRAPDVTTMWKSGVNYRCARQ